MLGINIQCHEEGQRCAVLSHSVVSDSFDPRDCSRQAPPSMGFSRQEYWSGLPFPPPEDLPDPRIKPVYPVSPALQTDSWVHPKSACFQGVVVWGGVWRGPIGKGGTKVVPFFCPRRTRFQRNAVHLPSLSISAFN